MYKKVFEMRKVLISVLMMILTSFSVFAIVGHPAAQIFPGLFASGNYTFGGSVLFIDDTNDRVGVGTTSPEGKLDVVGSLGKMYVHAIGTVLYINRTGLSKVKFEAAGDGRVGTETDDDFSIHTNNTEKMRITNAGNVGIGTVSPGQLLEVSGNATITGNLGLNVQYLTCANDAACDGNNDTKYNIAYCPEGYIVTGCNSYLSEGANGIGNGGIFSQASTYCYAYCTDTAGGSCSNLDVNLICMRITDIGNS